MKKLVLKKVDLVEFKDFIDSLVPLSSTGTVYFKISKDGLSTDSHNDSGTIIKSLKTDISKLCEGSNLQSLEESVKLCFYEGKKVLKALSYLSGNEINCEITYAELETEEGLELFAETMKISSPKVSIPLDAADPTLFEFANVPQDAIASVKDTSSCECEFRTTANEIMQIKKYADFDVNDEIIFEISDSIVVSSKDSISTKICDEFEGVDEKYVYKVSKNLFTMIDNHAYTIHCSSTENKLVFKSDDGTNDVVVTLNEDDSEYADV